MAVINVSGAQAGFDLRGDGGRELLLGKTCEVAAQQVRAVLLERERQRLPGAAPVARNVAAGNVFHLARPNVRAIELHLGGIGGKTANRENQNEGHGHTNQAGLRPALDGAKPRPHTSTAKPRRCTVNLPHCWPPTLTSLPITTPEATEMVAGPDRKSTRLNSSHVEISYAVFCLKKKKK